MWTQTGPTDEGWYFWRRARNVKDPWKWNAYFVAKNNPEWNAYYASKNNPEPFSFWEAGTEVRRPRGGWWMRIDIPKGEGL